MHSSKSGGTCLHLTWTSRGTAMDDSCFGCQRGGVVLTRRSGKYFSCSRRSFLESSEMSFYGHINIQLVSLSSWGASTAGYQEDFYWSSVSILDENSAESDVRGGEDNEESGGSAL